MRKIEGLSTRKKDKQEVSSINRLYDEKNALLKSVANDHNQVKQELN